MWSGNGNNGNSKISTGLLNITGAINDRYTNQFVLSYPTSDTGRTYMWQVSGFSFLA